MFSPRSSSLVSTACFYDLLINISSVLRREMALKITVVEGNMIIGASEQWKDKHSVNMTYGNHGNGSLMGCRNLRALPLTDEIIMRDFPPTTVVILRLGGGGGRNAMKLATNARRQIKGMLALN